MKHVLILVPALLFGNAAAAAECDFIRAETILSEPRPESPDDEYEVLEQQSGEGGAWSVYNGSGGKPDRIARDDLGEMGRVSVELAVEAGGTYVIRKTRFYYSVPIAVSGSRIIRQEADIYRFCNAELVVPPDAIDEAYIKAARAAAAQFFSAPEVAKTLIAAGLKPPLWK